MDWLTEKLRVLDETYMCIARELEKFDDKPHSLSPEEIERWEKLGNKLKEIQKRIDALLLNQS
jgi:hypothetical protein